MNRVSLWCALLRRHDLGELYSLDDLRAMTNRVKLYKDAVIWERDMPTTTAWFKVEGPALRRIGAFLRNAEEAKLASRETENA